MKRTFLMVAVISLCASSLANAADRLTDRDVKSLVARIEQGRDRFDDALDDRLKNSVVRGPSGEMNVKDFLNDFQESIDRLEERLKPEYAASAEAATVLRRASLIDAFLRGQPAGTRGESEWNRLATDLRTLAAAYGADFPLAEGAPVRRIGDRELEETAKGIADTANRLKKSLDNDLKKDTTVDRQAREAIVAEADQLSKEAKTLRERVKDGDPSSAEARQVLNRAANVQSFIDGHQVPASAAAWSSVTERLQSVASAYGGSWPPSAR